MQLGESASFIADLQSSGKCVICDQEHKNKKTEDVKPVTESNSGWERKNMDRIFDTGDANRSSIYVGSVLPSPSTYQTEGHHCLAYSSFIKGNGEDVCLRLNFFLDQVGFAPNDAPNVIQLPGRRGPPQSPRGPWPVGVYETLKSFWVSIDQGKPLQLHVGRHNGAYFGESESVVQRLIVFASDPNKCEEETIDQFKERLKGLITGAVNYAFKCVAENTWVCHSSRLGPALSLYRLSSTEKHNFTVEAGTPSNKRTLRMSLVGYGGTGDPPPPWQTVNLITSPFV
ncbi:hypothetical protein [Sorangium sp. So ce1182]|uniref:hypothetical protein n=1 Tax=Sorangium sp. So ce1182 TaxID=3133334 RepID=UPI003F5F5EDF